MNCFWNTHVTTHSRIWKISSRMKLNMYPFRHTSWNRGREWCSFSCLRLVKELIRSFCIWVISAVFPIVLYELIHAKHQRWARDSITFTVFETSPHEKESNSNWDLPSLKISNDPGPSTTLVSKVKWPNIRNESSACIFRVDDSMIIKR